MLKVVEEAGLSVAVLMELLSSSGKVQRFYGATRDPFDKQYERIYGIPPL